jgi:hypothetical protein
MMTDAKRLIRFSNNSCRTVLNRLAHLSGWRSRLAFCQSRWDKLKNDSLRKTRPTRRAGIRDYGMPTRPQKAAWKSGSSNTLIAISHLLLIIQIKKKVWSQLLTKTARPADEILQCMTSDLHDFQRTKAASSPFASAGLDVGLE